MAGSVIKTSGVNIAGRGKQESNHNVNNLSGTFIGVVTDNKDSLYTGRITVKISDFSSTDADRICLLAIPFGGVTDILGSANSETTYGDIEGSEGGSPKSYGMWPQPPAIGTNVVVVFTVSHEQGIVMGSLIAKDRNAMMGGNSSSQAYQEDESVKLSPSSEKNPYGKGDADTRPGDTESYDTLVTKGTQDDYLRGHSMSSARRESPSRVFGITTKEGHTISLDDGNENGVSKNIRIKTRGGAQILMDDTNNFIHITNQTGSAWFEMDEEGRIDVYSQKDISYHAEGDFNLHAKGNINMQADQGVNIKSKGSEGIKLESSVGSLDMFSSIDVNIQASANHHVKVAGNYIMTGGRIDMNGPAANPATKPTEQSLTVNSGVLTSVASRVPEHQPWMGNSSVQESFDTGEGNTS